MTSITVHLEDENQTILFGIQLSKQVVPPFVIYLQGTLGAGKTTLVRGFLRGLGYQGIVKSPTYTFVETYRLSQVTVYHLDLYRIQDARELDFLGIEEIEDKGVVLIEWPDQGLGHLVQADLVCWLDVVDDCRRTIRCENKTIKGKAILQQLQQVGV